jgi:predicted nucleotide-binding protein (sugar kinase/HSP70/actin superfamily)
MKPTIGFPATLFYYTDAPFWYTFFENIGYKVIFSSATNNKTLDAGIRVTVTDACVPIKVYHGHVIALKDKVDCLFIPRYVSLEKKETFCPKFLGLPSMVRSSIPGLPEIIAPDIELGRFFSQWRFCSELAERTGVSFAKVIQAVRQAGKVQKNYLRLLRQGYIPQKALKLIKGEFNAGSPNRQGDLNIAVLGYPYQIHDSHISVNLLKQLKQLGVNIWTMEMVSENMLRPYRKIMAKNHFWHFSNRVIWSLFYFLNKGNLDGVIHVTAFACGPDAMVDKFMELELKQRKIPFMPITID